MEAKLYSLAIVSSLTILAAPAANAQSSERQTAEAALAQAREAQAAALEALNEANAAIKAAELLMRQPEPKADHELASRPSTPSSSETSSPKNREVCIIDAEAPGRILKDPNNFHQTCLDLKKFKDFEVASLNLQYQGSNDSSLISIIPSYTKRFRTPLRGEGGDPTSYRTRYETYGAGIRVAIDPGKKTATFADLTTPEIASGVQGVLNFEMGGTVGHRPISDFTKPLQKTLQQAREACITEKRSALSFTTTMSYNSDVDRLIESCQGDNLSIWMSKEESAVRANEYYRSIVQPLWNHKKGLRYYLGLQGTYAKPEYSFFPLSDPAATGIVPTIDTLPDEFPGGAAKLSEETYSIKGYGGIIFDDDFSLGVALSYRRDFAFPKNTEKQTVCNETPAAFTRCFTQNIAPPFELDGIVVGGRFAAQLPRLGFLPSLGIELKPSYALDVEQLGLQASIYFANGSDGKQQGGIIVGCTSNGETANGFALEEDCRASLFFGTSFSLDSRP